MKIKQKIDYKNYTRNTKFRINKNEPPINIKNNKNPPKFYLYKYNNIQYYLRMRKRPKCINTYNFTSGNFNSIYNFIALHTPFRDELKDLLQLTELPKDKDEMKIQILKIWNVHQEIIKENTYTWPIIFIQQLNSIEKYLYTGNESNNNTLQQNTIQMQLQNNYETIEENDEDKEMVKKKKKKKKNHQKK